jgi:hypothetical protein
MKNLSLAFIIAGLVVLAVDACLWSVYRLLAARQAVDLSSLRTARQQIKTGERQLAQFEIQFEA